MPPICPLQCSCFGCSRDRTKCGYVKYDDYDEQVKVGVPPLVVDDRSPDNTYDVSYDDTCDGDNYVDSSGGDSSCD